MIIDTRTQKQVNGTARGKVSYMTCTSAQARQWTGSNGGNAYGYAARYCYTEGIPLDSVTMIVNGDGVYIAHLTIDPDGVITQDTSRDMVLVHQFSFDKSRNVSGS